MLWEPLAVSGSRRGRVSVGSSTGADGSTDFEEPGVIQMAEGTIKKIVADRGFGFISADDGKEYFFHRSAIANFDALRGGERVSFEMEPSPKGPRAGRVRVI
jgi:cold shock protein